MIWLGRGRAVIEVISFAIFQTAEQAGKEPTSLLLRASLMLLQLLH